MKNITILIIDDESVARNTLKHQLEPAGYKVVVANNGNEGIQFCQKIPIDIVITDIIMPEKDGIETIDEISRNHPNIKIIAISAGGSSDTSNYLAAAKLIGAAHVFKKPIVKADLLASIEGLISK